MILNSLFLALNIASLAALGIGLFYFLKQGRFEDRDNIKSYNILSLGLVLIIIITISNIIKLLAFYTTLKGYIWLIGINEDYLMYISNLSLVPLAGFLFVLAMLLIKKKQA